MFSRATTREALAYLQQATEINEEMGSAADKRGMGYHLHNIAHVCMTIKAVMIRPWSTIEEPEDPGRHQRHRRNRRVTEQYRGDLQIAGTL